MTAHLEFLKKYDSIFHVAGSLREEDGDVAVGGIWIVTAASFEEARALIIDDPFWMSGLRASVEVHRLSKAFPLVDKPV